LQFYSKSKDAADLGPTIPAHWRKILSNFWPADVEFEGKTFPSVEHFFQASKYLCSTRPELFEHFCRGGRWGSSSPAEAKSKGSKKGFKAYKADLDVAQWEGSKVERMTAFLKARYEQDDVFRAILQACHDKGAYLLHFERSGAKAYWGGSVGPDGDVRGTNKLGTIMMGLVAPQQSNVQADEDVSS
jgi:ribA/ribD-fused uncharacterized protein